MKAHAYIVTMHHDDGTFRVKVAASSPERAAAIVCDHEGAPMRSAVKVEEVRD